MTPKKPLRSKSAKSKSAKPKAAMIAEVETKAERARFSLAKSDLFDWFAAFGEQLELSGDFEAIKNAKTWKEFNAAVAALVEGPRVHTTVQDLAKGFNAGAAKPMAPTTHTVAADAVNASVTLDFSAHGAFETNAQKIDAVQAAYLKTRCHDKDLWQEAHALRPANTPIETTFESAAAAADTRSKFCALTAKQQEAFYEWTDYDSRQSTNENVQEFLDAMKPAAEAPRWMPSRYSVPVNNCFGIEVITRGHDGDTNPIVLTELFLDAPMYLSLENATAIHKALGHALTLAAEVSGDASTDRTWPDGGLGR